MAGRMCVAYLGNRRLQETLLEESEPAEALFSRITGPVTKQKWFRRGLKSTITSHRYLLGLQIPHISIKMSIYGKFWMMMLHIET